MANEEKLDLKVLCSEHLSESNSDLKRELQSWTQPLLSNLELCDALLTHSSIIWFKEGFLTDPYGFGWNEIALKISDGVKVVLQSEDEPSIEVSAGDNLFFLWTRIPYGDRLPTTRPCTHSEWLNDPNISMEDRNEWGRRYPEMKCVSLSPEGGAVPGRRIAYVNNTNGYGEHIITLNGRPL